MSALGLALVGVGLTACGQRGALYLPTDPIAKDRTTLPGLLLPTPPASTSQDADAPNPASTSRAPAGASK
ncbi:LPS translocon maturation chaperone LptM [Variovorax saccharolyticus]|uniref:LPS translocon maturation chaperone LptM n=1 Tax=Variovorax saccharolyticus TaxID=3053516 RepID=UPI002578BB6F|nr:MULTISPECIES: lipoprotein [unclassified Variovorax]MDM0017930.1 lipoprotein [Variovorax sp. J22R187]MDM0024901.1 lipoprotein [Variovorax sp. J31P216]